MIHIRLFVFCFLLLVSPSITLNIYTRTQQQHSFASHYGTLGYPPSQSIIANISILQASNFSESHCRFHETTNVSSLQGTLVVYVGAIPEWRYCLTDYYGQWTSLATLCQAAGALGVVSKGPEKFANGRIIGFVNEVTIPYLIMEEHDLEKISSMGPAITAIEFETSQEDTQFLNIVKAIYRAWRIISSIFFGMSIIVLVFILWSDLQFVPYREINWHIFAMKCLALISAILSFICIVVDPFGFKSTSIKTTCLAMVVCASFLVVFMMLLHCWIVAAGFKEKLQSKWFCHSVHAISFAIILVAFLRGYFWYYLDLNQVYWIFFFIIVLFSGVGFVFFGRKILQVLSNSGNITADARRLTIQLSSFVLLFVVFICSSMIIFEFLLLGVVFSFGVVVILWSFVIFVTFTILFVPASLKRIRQRLSKHRSERSNDRHEMLQMLHL